MKILEKRDGKTGNKHKFETIRVLLIENSRSFARRIREMLAGAEAINSVNSTYELVHADRLSTGLERLTEGGIDLVLLDLSLPDSEGLATLNRVYIRAPEVPVVVLTTLYDEELAVATLREGAYDYLVKRQVDSDLLVRSIRYAIEWHRLLAELQQKNRALATSKAYTESIIQNFLDTLIVVDAEAKIQTVNPASCHLLGYTEEELIGQPVSIIFAEEVRRVFQFFQEPKKAEVLRPQDTVHNYQLTCKTKDGQLIPMLFNASVLTDEVGNITGVVAEEKDITEIKQAEEALKKSRANFRRMIEKNADGIIIVDRNGVVRFVNPAGEALFGRKAEELLDESFGFPIVTDETTELEVIHRNNKTATVGMHVVEIEWEGDVAYLASLRDITERKQAEEALQRSFEKLQRTMEDTIQCMTRIVEMRDPYTAGHQRRVVQLACAMAKEFDFSKDRIDGICMAGLIHDIGKINVPSEILSKPGRLTELEFDMIKTHAQISYDILKTIDFPWPVARIALQHHERMDGSGYPQGLSGKDIMLEARILAVADVVEAMSSHRPYRKARGIDKALEEILQNRGILYDPRVVDACLKLFTEKGFRFE